MITRKGGHLALGVCIGCLLCLFFYILYSGLEFWVNDAFWGAAFGGVVALLGQILFIHYDQGRAEESKREERLSTLYELMRKLMLINQEIEELKGVYSTDSMESDGAWFDEVEQYLPRFRTTFIDRYQILANERIFLLKLRNNSAINAMFGVEKAIEAIALNIELYYESHQEIYQLRLNELDGKNVEAKRELVIYRASRPR